MQSLNHQDAARYLYNEFYMGQVRQAVMRNICNLRIADLLKDGPKDIKTLADLTASHEQSLHRIMITAFQMGIFNMHGDTFSLNVISDLLITDAPMSMCGLMKFMCEDYMVQSMNRIGETIYSGSPSFINVTGQTFYDYLSENEQQRRNFNAAMVCIDKTVSPLLSTKYNWSGVSSLVDLGGGVGASVLQILKDNPSINAAHVLEVEDVVDKAKCLLPEHQKIFGADNVAKLNFAVGNMFHIEDIPEADAYMLKNIIHDWNDSECDTLLSNVRAVMNGDSSKRLLVVEKIVYPDKRQPTKAGHDIVKLAFFHEHAKHRSVDNFRKMFTRNGFIVTTVVELLDTDYYVIEGRLSNEMTD